MGFKKNNPGCNCCGTDCAICADTFTRSDSYDLDAGSDCGWTQKTGDSHIVSQQVEMPTSNEEIISSTPIPSSGTDIKVSGSVTVATSADTFRVIFNYQNTNNYWIIEFKIGTGSYIRFITRSGGSNTPVATATHTIATGTYDFCVSLRDGSYVAASLGTAYSLEHRHSATASQSGWGFGVGTITGTPKLDHITAALVSADCPECRAYCTYCDPDDAPTQLKVVISGIATGTLCGTLASCQADYEGTFYLDKRGAGGTGCGTPRFAVLNCLWCLSVAQACVSLGGLISYIAGLDASGNFYFEVQHDATTARNDFYLLAASVPDDCNSWSNLTPAFNLQLGTPYCTWSGVTVEVSSV